MRRDVQNTYKGPLQMDLNMAQSVLATLTTGDECHDQHQCEPCEPGGDSEALEEGKLQQLFSAVQQLKGKMEGKGGGKHGGANMRKTRTA